MTTKHKSMRAVQDIREFPWQCYVLPSDSRKAKCVAEQRARLAMLLATYAHPDGTGITAGRERLLAELGWPLRTLARRLAELEQIGPGFLSTIGLTAEHGTAVRKLDISKLPGAGVPDSSAETGLSAGAGVPDSGAGVPDSTENGQQECQIAGAGVPDTIGTQPALPSNHHRQPPQQRPWAVEDWISSHVAEMGIPHKAARDELDSITAQHGESITVDVLDAFYNRPQGFGGMKASPWVLFPKEAPGYLAAVKATQLAAACAELANKQAGEKRKADLLAEYPGEAALIEEYASWPGSLSINMQKCRDAIFWNQKPAPENESEPLDYFAESEANNGK